MTYIPPYSSGMYLMQPAIFYADMQNTIYNDLTPWLTGGQVDWDINRQGAKSQLSATFWGGQINPTGDQWLAPFLTITPETGAPSTSQLGLFLLDDPERDDAGYGEGTAQVTGSDIIARLERECVTDVLTIPPYVNVMRAIRWLTEMCGRTKPKNIAVNPTFGPGSIEDAHWTYALSATMHGSWTPVTSRSFSTNGATKFTNSAPAGVVGDYAAVYQTTADLQAIVPGTTSMRIAFWYYTEDVGNLPIPRIEFQDSTGAQISGVSASAGNVEATANEWVYVTFDTPVPANTVTARAVIRVTAQNTTVAAGKQTWVDQIYLGATPSGGLTRHSYPNTTRQTGLFRSYDPGTNLLTPINDLLAALGYYAVYATRTGRPTSSPLRDANTMQPARTYDLGVDSAVTGTVKLTRSRSNLYNVVTVVKQDYTTKTTTVGVARNDDPNHRWSTVNVGEIARPPEQVTTEADQAALTALAQHRLRESSVTDALSLSIVPDPTLSVYDAIAITGGSGNQDGQWVLNQVTIALDPESPAMQLVANRTYSGVTS